MYTLTWVILGDPRHKVDNRLIMVDTDAEDFVSGVVVLVLAPGVPATKMSYVNRLSIYKFSL